MKKVILMFVASLTVSVSAFCQDVPYLAPDDASVAAPSTVSRPNLQSITTSYASNKVLWGNEPIKFAQIRMDYQDQMLKLTAIQNEELIAQQKQLIAQNNQMIALLKQIAAKK